MPEMLPMHDLPEVLDAGGILSNQQRLQILNGTADCACMPFESGLTPSMQARLIRQHLYEDPVAHPGVTAKRLNIDNFHNSTRAFIQLYGRRITRPARSPVSSPFLNVTRPLTR